MSSASPLNCRNALTVDVEDYFHVEAFASQVRYEEWDSFTPRVERNVKRILELFARYDAKATFFVLGWIAKKFPRLVQEIANAGHEIGSHGYKHKRLQILTRDEFRQDIRESVAVLTDQIHGPIRCYRAPSFSIVNSTMWALDILGEAGISFDSSVFPVRHDLYGVPGAERFPSWYVSKDGYRIFEFPPSTIRWCGQNLGVAGGGYLRMIPYSITRFAIDRINKVQKQPAMVYFHPWEIDPDQPRISGGRRSVMRHYTNLATTEIKIRRLLQDFGFGTLSEISSSHKSYANRPATPQEVPRSAAVARAAGSR